MRAGPRGPQVAEGRPSTRSPQSVSGLGSGQMIGSSGSDEDSRGSSPSECRSGLSSTRERRTAPHRQVGRSGDRSGRVVRRGGGGSAGGHGMRTTGRTSSSSTNVCSFAAPICIGINDHGASGRHSKRRSTPESTGGNHRTPGGRVAVWGSGWLRPRWSRTWGRVRSAGEHGGPGGLHAGAVQVGDDVLDHDDVLSVAAAERIDVDVADQAVPHREAFSRYSIGSVAQRVRMRSEKRCRRSLFRQRRCSRWTRARPRSGRPSPVGSRWRRAHAGGVEEMTPNADRNRCACAGDVNRRIARSRCRVG